ncbi:MAG: hypothetical protein GY820_22225 [Gammaproteobacteria bacterium]|nr:hypothetical protein [Gammaproteobacteria bacterium]
MSSYTYEYFKEEMSKAISSFKEDISIYKEIKKINKNDKPRKEKFLEIKNNIEIIDRNLNDIEAFANKAGDLEKNMTKTSMMQ